MSRKLVLNGREYLKKKLTKLLLSPGKAITISNKEAIAYDYGIVVVAMNDGSQRIFPTNGIENTQAIGFYEGNEVREQEILFGDDEMDTNWYAMYAYFFDDEGGYLLLTNKDILNYHGTYFESAGMNHKLFLRQKALNIAALFGQDIVKKIQNMDLTMTNEFSLLEVEASEWAEY